MAETLLCILALFCFSVLVLLFYIVLPYGVINNNNNNNNNNNTEYSCKISRQKTALTDTLKHTQAVSSADREQ